MTTQTPDASPTRSPVVEPGFAAADNNPTGLPMDLAPRDGTIVRLLVDYRGDGSGPLEDAEEAWTIGANSFDHTGEDQWRFAGWNWSQDYWCEGFGNPLAWAPFHSVGDASPTHVEPVAHLQYATLRRLVHLTWAREFNDTVTPSDTVVNELIEKAVQETGSPAPVPSKAAGDPLVWVDHPDLQSPAAPSGDVAGLVEKLARYLEPDAFDERRRSSRNQHAANKCRTYARRTAKRIAKWKLLPALSALSPARGGKA